MKQRPFLIGVTTAFLLIVYLLFRNCDSPTAPTAAELSGDTRAQSQSSDFTIYAITPTYARPVQKAELTR